MPSKFLIIQTAFIGDVVLATGIIEKLHQHFPDAQIDFLVRKGNESLLKDHPYLNEVLTWDKKHEKYLNLWKLYRLIRKRKYDKVINVQRFAASGFLTAFSGARETIGFDKNPFSWFFSKKIKHIVSKSDIIKHEISRNNDLISHFTDSHFTMPKLYPAVADFEFVKKYTAGSFITISPASVWFTKQFPAEKWVNFIDKVPEHIKIYLLGAANDVGIADSIKKSINHPRVISLCGQLSFLQSAALMKSAMMNYVNDSAPLHFASAMNAPVTAIYCSTIPSFGFGPLSDTGFIVEIEEKLICRPCSIHGKKTCPLSHFHCATKIRVEQLIDTLPVPVKS